MDTWLIVWGGSIVDEDVAEAVQEAAANHSEAHELLFSESETASLRRSAPGRPLPGRRSALLLVHYSEEERDRVVNRLRVRWAYGFINAVEDIS